MNIATLRAEGLDLELKAVCDSLSLNIDSSWKNGDTKRNGGIYTKSGFNACIADTNTSKNLTTLINQFVTNCKVNNLNFSSSSLSAQLDIGLGVGASEQFTASIKFSPNELKCFKEIGLELCISAYPISDNE